MSIKSQLAIQCLLDEIKRNEDFATASDTRAEGYQREADKNRALAAEARTAAKTLRDELAVEAVA